MLLLISGLVVSVLVAAGLGLVGFLIHQKNLALKKAEEKAKRQEHIARARLARSLFGQVDSLWRTWPERGQQLLVDVNNFRLSERDFTWGYYIRLCDRVRVLEGTRAGVLRGLQPRRQDPRLREQRPDGAAVGRGDGRRPAPPSRATRARCHAVAFSPDGKPLASAGGRRTGHGAAVGRGHGCNPRHPPGPRGLGARRGLQPRRQDPRLRERRPDGAAVGRGDGRGPRHPQGPRGLGERRGLQPRRQAPRLRVATTGRCGCGTRRRARPAAPSRATRTRCNAWPSARTARPSPRRPATRRCGCGTRRRARHARTLKGHAGSVYAVAFSPDGKTLAGLGVERQDGAAVGRGDGRAPRHPQGARGLGHAWPSARTARPLASRGRRRDGAAVGRGDRRSPASPSRGTRAGCTPWPSAPTARPWPPRVRGQDGAAVGRGDGRGPRHPQGALRAG